MPILRDLYHSFMTSRETEVIVHASQGIPVQESDDRDRRRKKQEMKRERLSAVLLAAAMLLGLAASAGAVDGTIEINQAKVLAAGGFPYQIKASGSYRLTSDLTVPASTDGIDVTVSNVTVDLNGFTITGPGGSSTPSGISAFDSDVTVENGTVTGFGAGVGVGSFGIVRNVHADVNGTGINVSSNTVVEGCTANNSFNAGGQGVNCIAACVISGNIVNGNPFGIFCTGNGCVISGNTAINNKDNAIDCNGSGCLISGNTILGNLVGIKAIDGTTGYGGNVLNANTVEVSGGTSLGHNLCSGVVC
jgi:parallel beta-helix repeat protein